MSGEQPNRRVVGTSPFWWDRQATQAHQRFVMQTESFTRGRQNAQTRRGVEKLPDHERAIDQTFEVVKHEQGLPIAAMVKHLIHDGKPRPDRDSACGRYRRWNIVCRLKWRQSHVASPVRKLPIGSFGDGARQRGLAHATWRQNCDEPVRAQQRQRFSELCVAPHDVFGSDVGARGARRCASLRQVWLLDVAQCPNRLNPVAGAQLGEDLPVVPFDRAFGQVQAARNLTV
ncbi:MAG TPA: hypothetical protein PLQ83_13030 [Thermoflexales bacterium]|nr:hypothetical protein [Thermoflexales bacterium]